MQRLRSGTILMDRFLQFLQAEDRRRRSAGATDPVAILEYVKCAEGAAAGQAFWSLMWGNGAADVQDWCIFKVEGVSLYMSRQTQQALKWKHVDYIDNQLVVPL